MDSFLLIAILIGIGVYIIYEKSNQATRPLSIIHKQVADEVKNRLNVLTNVYYNKYIYPHEFPQYTLHIPANKSETVNKTNVYVLINDPITGEIFDYNTIMQAGAHELAHMLCRVDERDIHGPVFTEILNRLNELGREMKLFDSRLDIPDRYKQLCV